MIRIVEATEAHGLELALNMREADADEAFAFAGKSPLEAVFYALGTSDTTWAALAGDRVLALYGVAVDKDRPEVASVWALTSCSVEEHKEAFRAAAAAEIEELQRGRRWLFNYVDARYTRALRWVASLGFEVLPAVPMGPCAMPFHPIRRRACASQRC